MKRFGLILAWSILLLGMARASVLVFAEPVAGYANQFDMLRTSACLGLWPVTAEDIPREQATPRAPIARYEPGERNGFNCLPGTESLVSGVAVMIARPFTGDTLDLRWIGGFKILLLFLVGAILQHAFRHHGGAAVLHAVIFAVVLCDPFNTLYANSLYTEFTALLGLYMALGSVMAASFRDTLPAPLLLLWFGGLLLLGGSRVQHLLLPAALVMIAWFIMRKRAPRAWWLSLVLAVVIGGAQLGLQRSSQAIDDANVVNTVFFSVLPAAEQPSDLARDLGLGEACAELAHTSWYLVRGQQHRESCPQAFELSRGRMLAVLLTQPHTFATLVFRALHQSGGWRLSYVGEVAGEDHQRVPGLRGASLAGIIAGLTFGLYAVFYALPLWPGLWTAWRLVKYGALLTPARLALGVGFFSLASVMVIVFGTSLIGDGYSEFARHAHLAHNAAVMIWLLTPVALVRLVRLYGRRALWVPLAGYGLLAMVVVVLARSLPLASGVADRPDTVYIETGQVDLAGWVADPYGVRALWAETDDGQRWPLSFRPAPQVGDYLPVGEKPVRFEARIDAAPSSGRELRLRVSNSRGVETVFERRYFE